MKVFTKIICIAFIVLSYTTANAELLDELDNSIEDDNNIPEGELINVIAKLIKAKKNKDKEAKEKEYINVIIDKTHDLRQALGEVYSQRDQFMQMKRDDEKTVTKKLKEITDKLSESSKSVAKLKDSYDTVINQSNDVNQKLNTKRDEELKLKSSLDAYGNKALIEINEFVKNTQSLPKLNKDFKENFNKYSSELAELASKLKENSKLEEKLDNLQTNLMKNKIKLELKKKSKGKITIDTKLLDIIKSNQENKLNEIHESSKKIFEKMSSKRKIIGDNSNKVKMEAEKSKGNEEYLENNRKMKDLFTQHEEVENQVKDLLKKKNKLANDLSSKEVEDNITQERRKNVLKNLSLEFKKTEREVLEVLDNNKQFLKKKENRIKKLIIILNKLLLEHAKKAELLPEGKASTSLSSDENDSLTNILFDKKKSMNLKNISKTIVEEVTNQIVSH